MRKRVSDHERQTGASLPVWAGPARIAAARRAASLFAFDCARLKTTQPLPGWRKRPAIKYDDLIGQVTHWGVTTNGRDKHELLRYLITEVDDDGMLVGVCLNEGPGALRQDQDRHGSDKRPPRFGPGDLACCAAKQHETM